MNAPRWHGWARPEDVREMMQEMYQFLKENNEPCPFTTIPAQTAEPLKTYGPELKNQT